METIRTFIAIPLPEPLLAQLARVQRQLEKRMPPHSVRWVRAESIHLTLKFLGDTPTEKLPQIDAALAAVAQNAPACTFTVAGLGCFPNPRRPRVLWVGVQEPTGRLAALQDAIEGAVAPFGYPPEGRGFTPHLTLGRVHRRADRRDVARVGEVVTATEVGTLGQVSVDYLALIRSLLKPTGAEYTTLAEFRLNAEPRA
ncbi:MAG TPA: RNA 2',3'-cyclic phosphodiesterase [Anaerolineales bacterium]|nr:RNA 2',3'-cyclic phosphodiesterase [Anaerolineae bacterium]HIQ02148.1 RNA 2',3'-cyclic phosphodiesterase [Anaerolineales bacterium]